MFFFQIKPWLATFCGITFILSEFFCSSAHIEGNEWVTNHALLPPQILLPSLQSVIWPVPFGIPYPQISITVINPWLMVVSVSPDMFTIPLWFYWLLHLFRCSIPMLRTLLSILQAALSNSAGSSKLNNHFRPSRIQLVEDMIASSVFITVILKLQIIIPKEVIWAYPGDK